METSWPSKGSPSSSSKTATRESVRAISVTSSTEKICGNFLQAPVSCSSRSRTSFYRAMLVLSIMENPALQAALQAPMEYKNSFAGSFAGSYGIQKQLCRQLCRLLWNTKTALQATLQAPMEYKNSFAGSCGIQKQL